MCSAESVGFADGTLAKLNAKLIASKTLLPSDTGKGWFAGLQSKSRWMRPRCVFAITRRLSRGDVSSRDDLVKFERLLVKRNQTQVAVRGQYRLPSDLRNVESQPAKVELSVNAPELADYWKADFLTKSMDRYKPMGGGMEKNGVGNGYLAISGSNLRMRNLVFHQLNGNGPWQTTYLSE